MSPSSMKGDKMEESRGIKKVKEILKEGYEDHNNETSGPCACRVCRAYEELQTVDRHRPEEHTIRDGRDGETVETHESFGLLQISRQTSMARVDEDYAVGANLFGSDVLHNHLICLKINRGERHRGLHRDWNFARAEGIVEVVMSEVQFAQAITSLNMGSGVPCTITRLMGESMEDCPERTKMQEVHREFKETMKKIGSKITELSGDVEDILGEKGPLKVGAKKELADKMRSLLQDIESNVPFMATQFSETMNTIVGEAKGEVEAYVTSTVQRAGLKAMAEAGMEGLTESPLAALTSGGTIEGGDDVSNDD